VGAVEGGYVPEGGVTIRPEGMPCVRRDYDDVARFRNHIDPADAVDAASLVHNEHFTAGMAMVRRAATGRIVADRDRDVPKIVLVAVNEPNRSTWRVFAGANV